MTDFWTHRMDKPGKFTRETVRRCVEAAYAESGEPPMRLVDERSYACLRGQAQGDAACGVCAECRTGEAVKAIMDRLFQEEE